MSGSVVPPLGMRIGGKLSFLGSIFRKKLALEDASRQLVRHAAGICEYYLLPHGLAYFLTQCL